MTAIIGAGGKSTLLRTLAGELSEHGRVIVATSTKMFVPDWCPAVLGDAPSEAADSTAGACELLAEIDAAPSEGSVVCVGSVHEPTGKLQAPNADFSALAGLADYVLVEADGAKRLPLKAHAAHEPVIPDCANLTVCVAGADGVGRPIARACHRARRFAQLAGVSEDDFVMSEAVAAVLNAEALHDVLLINKVESGNDRRAAERIAALVDTPVVAGSLWRNEFRCLR